MHHNGYWKFAGWNLICWLKEPLRQLEMVYLALYVSVDIPLYYFLRYQRPWAQLCQFSLKFSSAVNQCCICIGGRNEMDKMVCNSSSVWSLLRDSCRCCVDRRLRMQGEVVLSPTMILNSYSCVATPHVHWIQLLEINVRVCRFRLAVWSTTFGASVEHNLARHGAAISNPKFPVSL